MEPSAKRIKLSRGQDDYLPGNIIEIELCNFMTFDELIVKPGSRLNLVVGPNGSGKSSVVCAIALGLGGEPQLLGRASSVGAYVKRGEESGYIRISLRGEALEEQISIKRKIDRHNKSEWMLNGKVVPKKDVVEIIQRFNIQVNNLTQFLPQDRVCEFAKLTPVQLLEETERAVGDPQLPIQHHSLVDKSHELKRLEVTVKQNGDTLNQLKALNAEQEKDVKRVRQREELLAKVESMRKKLPWLKYDKKQDEWKKAKENADNAKRELAEAARVANDHKERLEEQQRKLKEDGNCKKERNLLDANIENRKMVLDKESSLGVHVRGKYNRIVELRREEESRQETILKEKEDLAVDKLQLANWPTHDDRKDKIRSLNLQIRERDCSHNEKKLNISGKEKALNEKREELRKCLNSLRDMESANNKLLQALKNTGGDYIFQAYHWVQEHRHELNKEIYGPVLLEVKVQQPVFANYLEAHVPKYIWKAFITQDCADRDLLVRNLTKFDVAVINYDMAECSNKVPFAVSEEMRKLGIYCRLDQVFDAPNAVKEVLTSLSGLEHAFVGTKETDRKANEVQRLGIFDLWTPENHYRWIRSRYGGHVSASVEHVPGSRLFQSSANVMEIEKCRSKKKELEEIIVTLEERCKKLRSESKYLDEDTAELRKQCEELFLASQHDNKKRRDLENRISQRERKIRSLEEGEDMDTITKKLLDEAAELNLQRFQTAIDLKKSLVEAVSHKWSYTIKHMSSIELETKIRELEIDFKQKERFAREASQHYNFCKKESSENHRRVLVALKREAESIAVITPELEQEFLKMPSTIEDLETAIEDNISQANSILFLNQNILEEYESRQRKIEAISRKLEADDMELKRCLAEIDALKGKWLPRLRNLVAKINETFSRNFQEMAVAGEVSLDEHDMDYDKFGIVIKVKFRQTGQLQVLSAHHQSGGERSVSTILYLVSLQDLTHCPFRVVDEINQGMDPINERKMFQQLVRAASQPNTPQCFLLTPKLLSNLQYSEACCVLHIMNGPWIEEPAKVWHNGESWKTAIGMASGG
ncbi:structural maintenance of chromosomes protein 5 isoform X1 [Telopea speciosissima]|uniref:structural maintenance of chromosomes protein 5 isoform X1 n=1 Tax=Telopea speciosissima TaxID=54955 RepID=UPI001CC61410|nr:structural maintenance of chromosomes protein 5 isoform X1 [Telopea speciosissima]